MKYVITTSDKQTIEFTCYSVKEKGIIRIFLKVNDDMETPYTKQKALEIMGIQEKE